MSPLGSYLNIGALLGSAFALGAAVLVHVLFALGIAPVTDPFLDNLGVLGFGVLVGQVGLNAAAQSIAAGKINGQAAAVQALHTRLDQAGIPPAATPEPAPADLG